MVCEKKIEYAIWCSTNISNNANCKTAKKLHNSKKMHNSKNECRNHTTTWQNCENKGTTVKTKAQLQKIFLLFTLHCLLRLLDFAQRAIPRSPPRSTLHACSSQPATVTIHNIESHHRSTSMVGCRGCHFLPTIFPWSYVGQQTLPLSFEEGLTVCKSTPILKTPPTLET